MVDIREEFKNEIIKYYNKGEIREIVKNNLIVYDKKDSQGLCFAKSK